MADISIRNVGKIYPGGFQAISDISLDIGDGQLCVLVGPSGCGKSTLLRMVAGLETVTEGEIAIGGRAVNGLEPAQRDIAMVFQNYALYPHMSVYDNMAYGLRNRGTSKPEIEERVREAARLLGLEDFLGRKPRQLSGGQRQRVAMGRAIVRQPQVFLFDEPLSNLDAKLRVKTRVEIRALQQRAKTTSIYVTHDQLEAMTLADRLVVMNAGKVEQVGTPIEVYERPASTFVATFIGSPPMNILPAEAIELAAGAAPALDRFPAREETLVGVRPEDLSLEAASSSGVRIAFTVVGVEPLGAETLVHGKAADGTDLTLRAPGHLRLESGTETVAAAGPEALHVFRKSDGLAAGRPARPA